MCATPGRGREAFHRKELGTAGVTANFNTCLERSPWASGPYHFMATIMWCRDFIGACGEAALTRIRTSAVFYVMVLFKVDEEGSAAIRCSSPSAANHREQATRDPGDAMSMINRYQTPVA